MNEKDQTAAAQVPSSFGPQGCSQSATAPAAAPIKPVMTIYVSGKVIPSDTEIIHSVAVAFQVDDATALDWIIAMFERQAA